MAKLKFPYPRDIFCIEGKWQFYDPTDRATVKHVLDLLEDLGVVKKPIYRRPFTLPELEEHLQTWCQKKCAPYSMGYLAFHGEPFEIYLDGKTAVSLDDIAETLDGKGCGRFIHFSSCATLDVHKAHLKRFLKVSGCSMVTGYTHPNVDWVDTAAFETMLFRDLQMRSTPKGCEAYMKQFHRRAWALGQKLGFRMAYL